MRTDNRKFFDELIESLFEGSRLFPDNDASVSSPLRAPTVTPSPDDGLRVAYFRSNLDKYGFGLQRNTAVVYRPRQSKNHTIEVATAVTSLHDVFDRKVGRRMATARFNSGETVKLPPRDNAQSDYELLRAYFG